MTTNAPIIVSWSSDFEEKKINVRFLQDIDLIHSCQVTNTYVMGPDALRDSDNMLLSDQTLDLLWDLKEMNGEALPFGQVMFISYYSNGEFIIESATERWSPLVLTTAFESFGYTDVKIIGNFVSVSEKDQFKLKLKFGI